MSAAIITGASSGLGREFARQIATKEHHITEIWVIARRKDRLASLAEELSVPIRQIAMDITDSSQMDSFRQLLAEEKPQVALLVNAAGMGKIGTYKEISNKDSLAMIDLNCRAAVDMTQSVLPFMKKGGRILEICSTAAFQPLPGMNIYASSKAFLLNYSRALNAELHSRHIRVTAVCPYWIRDTEFIPVASQTNSAAVKHFPLASRTKSVASLALFDSSMGFAVSTPGIFCTFHRFFSKVIPHSLLVMIWNGIRRV